MTLHQRSHVTVACAPEQIAFPMTGDGSVFYFRRSLADRNGVDDLALRVSVNAGVPRAADTPFRAQVLNQLLFKCLTAKARPEPVFKYRSNLSAKFLSCSAT